MKAIHWVPTGAARFEAHAYGGLIRVDSVGKGWSCAIRTATNRVWCKNYAKANWPLSKLRSALAQQAFNLAPASELQAEFLADGRYAAAEMLAHEVEPD